MERADTADVWDDVTVGTGSTQEIERPEERARLIALAGPQAGRVYEIEGDTLIGRSLEAAVRIDSGDVSRHHACISQGMGGGWVVRDLGSRNGTLVNRAPLLGEPRALSYGDRLQFGATSLFIFSHYDDLEEQILRSQRMEAVGRLAGGIVHDLNNVMTAVVGTVDYLQALAREGSPVGPEQLGECLDDISQACARAIDLTRGLLGFSGSRDSSRAESVDMMALAREVVQLCRHTFPDNIRVQLRTGRPARVLGHGTQLHQVLMNLCLNARDAMPDGGELAISVDCADLETAGAAIPFLAPGAYALITVADSGIGMDPETARRAFEPFFTTKQLGEGTGLGLATVYGLVRNHGGYVQLDSAEGRGTAARVYLPAHAGGDDSAKVASSPYDFDLGLGTTEEREPSRGTLLVVDDEQQILRSTRRLLSGLGWNVLMTTDAREAVAIMARRMDDISLVLLDIVMPRLGGIDVFRIMRHLAPAVPVVLMSGHDPHGEAKVALDAGAAAFLQKPFDGKALRGVLEQLASPARHGRTPTSELGKGPKLGY